MPVADKNIGSLPAAATVNDDSLFVAEQQGEAVKVSGAQFKGYAQSSVSQYVTQAQQAATQALQASEQALEAVDGIGTAVEDTQENALAAQTAQSAAEEAKIGAETARDAIANMTVEAEELDTGQDVYVTKTLVSGVYNLRFGLPRGQTGAQGDEGEPGSSIQSIVRTSGTGAAGTTDTYTVYLTDGSIGGTFQVYNGADGIGAGDMLKATYDPQNFSQDIFAYADNLDCGIWA